MQPDGGPASADPRRITLFVAALTVAILLIVPWRILDLGWIPPDDARRHAAKVVSDRSWSEILVLRPESTIDPHAGWHAILGVFELAGIDTPAGLLEVSALLLATLALLAPLPFFRRPEAWLLALLVVAVFEPRLVTRLLMGRPLVVTISALTLVALLSPRLAAERVPRAALLGTAALVALSVWTHGSGWYLWLLPVGAFALAGERRATPRLAGCVAIGWVLGALATGQPFQFLRQNALIPVWALAGADGATVVGEFQPFDGTPIMLVAVAALWLARDRLRLADAWRISRPLFAIAAVGWLLGFVVRRFWIDWGLPALLVALALEIQAALESPRAPAGLRRLLLTSFVAVAVFLAFTSNFEGRWTLYPENRLAALERPEMSSWLPEPGGIVYSNDMWVFYDLFFQHPKAEWRYQVGFEPGFMPPADLQIFRSIVRENASVRSLRLWTERMLPQDRMILVRRSSRAPEIGELEWVSPRANLWVGRVRRSGTATSSIGNGPALPASPTYARPKPGSP